jgi:hypothetical protein
MHTCLDRSWWTEAHATWTEAIALILIFGLDAVLAFFTLEERTAARHERKQAEIARQKSEVSCVGVYSVARNKSVEQQCEVFWNVTTRQAGFSFEKRSGPARGSYTKISV